MVNCAQWMYRRGAPHFRVVNCKDNCIHHFTLMLMVKHRLGRTNNLITPKYAVMAAYNVCPQRETSSRPSQPYYSTHDITFSNIALGRLARQLTPVGVLLSLSLSLSLVQDPERPGTFLQRK